MLLQKGIEGDGNFTPYLEQLGLMRTAIRAEWKPGGELRRTTEAMDRFMDMLRVRAGGIRPEAAAAIWDFCIVVAPIALHYERHNLGELVFTGFPVA